MDNLAANRKTRKILEDELLACGAKISGYGVRCPFHDDTHASGSIHCDSEGVWRFKCHVCNIGGDYLDVKAIREGKKSRDVFKQLKTNEPMKKKKTPAKVYASLEEVKASLPGKVEACHYYYDPDTKVIELVVFRLRLEDRKSFRQVTPASNGCGWVMKGAKKPWPIYNRDKIKDAEKVFIVEGEKCADTLNRLGFAATTSPGGAGKANYADWSMLAGKKVYIWPDNDEPGLNHANEVKDILSRFDPAPEIYIVDPIRFGLTQKEDAHDLCEQLGDESFVEILENIDQYADKEDIWDMFENEMEAFLNGKRESIPLHHPMLTKLTRALFPGSVTLLCGDPGSSKSLFLLEMSWKLLVMGRKIAILELEDDRVYHLMRAFAQFMGESKYFNESWMRKNKDAVRQGMKEHKDFTKYFANRMWDSADGLLSRKDLFDWIEARCKEGCRVITIDPITAIEQVENTWIEDTKFMIKVNQLLRKYGASLVIVTHSVKLSKGNSTMGHMAGGAGYSRFAHTILWLEDIQGKELLVTSSVGSHSVEVDRLMRILKARNSYGAKKSVAFAFGGDSLNFQELGIVNEAV